MECWKRIKKALCIVTACILSSILFVGCNAISTFNYQTSQSVFRSAIAESKKPKELNGQALIVFVSEDNKWVRFQHTENKSFGSTTIDKKSFAAFVAKPGPYKYQEEILSLEPNKCYFVLAHNKGFSFISAEDYEKNYKSDRYLVKESLFCGDVRSAADFFTNKVSGVEVFFHYFGVGLGVACQIVVITIIVGLFVLLIVAEAKSGQSSSINTISVPQKKITPNAYGPGVHMDQYGRAFEWQVVGNPYENTAGLSIQPDAYGPGMGMDQYGRAVKAVYK